MQKKNVLLVALFAAFLPAIIFATANTNIKIPPNRNSTDEAQAALDMMEMNDNLTLLIQIYQEASWKYNTNVTSENEDLANEKYLEFSNAYFAYHKEVIEFYEWQNFQDPYLVRQFQRQSSLGTSALNDTSLNELNQMIGSMTAAFTNRVCPYANQGCDAPTEGYDIDRLEVEMALNRDFTELTYYWEQWREVSGNQMIDQYERYIELENLAAQLNGFSDAGEMWLQPYSEGSYTTDDFKNEVEGLWQTMKPLYMNLHAYVRYRLRQFYGSMMGEVYDPIPANILGNMWAQSWENVYDLVVPFASQELLDLTDILEQKIKNETEMFLISEDFFTSIATYTMTNEFWTKSVFVQPSDRTVICHASAWDFLSTVSPQTLGDYRIKMCTNKNQEDFITIHHEMGHTEYQMAYSEVGGTTLPTIFRDGANPGFHEAIGDTIALSVSTPSHLQMIYDYLNSTKDSFEKRKISSRAAFEQDINFLMKTALAKVAFIPFAYILDQWRWSAFSGITTRDIYNYNWWDMRLNYQGVAPPVLRHPSTDFDIGCKYHVPSSVPYIRYFVSHILQFQFHDQMCLVSGNTNAIYNCDIYGSTPAGQLLRDSVLIKGASEPWMDILADFMGTPQGNMDAASIQNYFQPLSDFLLQEITNLNIPVGWNATVDDYMEFPKAVPVPLK